MSVNHAGTWRAFPSGCTANMVSSAHIAQIKTGRWNRERQVGFGALCILQTVNPACHFVKCALHKRRAASPHSSKDQRNCKNAFVPTFFPDGQWIVFVCTSVNGTHEIYRITAKGEQAKGDSRRIILVENGGLLEIDGTRGQPHRLPFAQTAVGEQIASRGNRLDYVQMQSSEEGGATLIEATRKILVDVVS